MGHRVKTFEREFFQRKILWQSLLWTHFGNLTNCKHLHFSQKSLEIFRFWFRVTLWAHCEHITAICFYYLYNNVQLSNCPCIYVYDIWQRILWWSAGQSDRLILISAKNLYTQSDTPTFSDSWMQKLKKDLKGHWKFICVLVTMLSQNFSLNTHWAQFVVVVSALTAVTQSPNCNSVGCTRALYNTVVQILGQAWIV